MLKIVTWFNSCKLITACFFQMSFLFLYIICHVTNIEYVYDAEFWIQYVFS